MVARNASRCSSGTPCHMGVSTTPGAITLTRMGASSTASERQKAASAPSTAAINAVLGTGFQAEKPEKK